MNSIPVSSPHKMQANFSSDWHCGQVLFIYQYLVSHFLPSSFLLYQSCPCQIFLWHDLCQLALFSTKSSTVTFSLKCPKGNSNLFSSWNSAEHSRKISYGVKRFTNPEAFKGHLRTSLVAFWHIKHDFQSVFLKNM